ncbi:MAG: hypothetical protein QMC77_01600 [Methanocellales archaeon]|nr:hypothetical protein [Methanocellales archaeon]
MRRLITFGIIFLLVLAMGSQSVFAQTQNLREVPEKRRGIPDILMVKEKVHPEVFLEEVSPNLTVKTTLKFDTRLEDPFWRITTYGETSETKTDDRSTFTFDFDHAAFDNMTIKLDGTAPEVEKRTYIVLMEIKIGDEVLTSISVDVTTEEFIGVYRAIHDAEMRIIRAEEEIASAEDAGVPSSMLETAKDFLESAEKFLENARAFYDAAKMNESRAAAEHAYDEATRAYDSARAAKGEHAGGLALVALGKYGIIAGIVIALLIVAVIAYKRRRWDRLG